MLQKFFLEDNNFMRAILLVGFFLLLSSCGQKNDLEGKCLAFNRAVEATTRDEGKMEIISFKEISRSANDEQMVTVNQARMRYMGLEQDARVDCYFSQGIVVRTEAHWEKP